MASPIGHSLAGYAVCSFFDRNGRKHQCLLAVFMALAPDLDFIPGLLSGTPALYHQGLTHSLGFALVTSLGVAVIFYLTRRQFSPVFFLCFISYISHLMIDFFGPDGRPPYGQPLLWPVSKEYFISQFNLFWGMHHAGLTGASMCQWVRGLLSPYNIGAIIVEVVLIGPLVFLGRLSQVVFAKPAK